MRRTPILAALLALALPAGLTACGGGGSSSASPAAQGGSTAAATAPNSAPSTTTASGKGKAPTAPKGSSPSSGSGSGSSAGAKSFVKPHGDNSIPTFGSEAAGSERSRAEAALRAYLAARAKGNWAAACSGLAASVRKQVQAFAGAAKGKAGGCPPLYKALSASTPASARANPLSGAIVALRIKGQSGFALFYGPHSQQYVMPMVNEGGAWKVGELAPIAYPLGSETTAP